MPLYLKDDINSDVFIDSCYIVCSKGYIYFWSIDEAFLKLNASCTVILFFINVVDKNFLVYNLLLYD